MDELSKLHLAFSKKGSEIVLVSRTTHQTMCSTCRF